MRTYTIELAGDPVGKARPRFSRLTGTAYTPAKTVNFETRLAYAAQAVMRGRLLRGALHVEMTAWLEVPKSKSKKFLTAALAGQSWPTKKPDADNVAKCLDALNKVVWMDDSQIVDLIVHKRWSDNPRTVITVTTMENVDE